MDLNPGDLVTLKGDKPGRLYKVRGTCGVNPRGYQEALVEFVGEAWNRPVRVVPVADLKRIPPDLEDFD